MSSIIPGYTYDIFISYRQKDNKYDGWVTAFVDNLKNELEATFKEDISVYFDINPHDGLMETHDVKASIKEKVKCLIFIPIISRTYCDPKSFAWEHEFKAFIELASRDQFGSKIKLPDGNVASRIIPVIIHNLDKTDIKMCESVTGGVLRGIEFVYKEPGVNRPLRPDDDDKGKTGNPRYRNQINKAANAIKEIVSGLSNPEQETGVILNDSLNINQVPPKKRNTKIFIAVLILAALSVFGILIIPKLLNSDEVIEKSIAVLPFDNWNSDPEYLHLGEAIAEEIILELNNIKDFDRVLSRSSTMQFLEKRPSIPEIAEKLGVNYIIEGSIQRQKEQVTVRVQVIRAKQEDHVWAQEYKGRWEDIFSIQEDIAKNVTKELKIALSPQEKENIEKEPTRNPEAYNLYLLGKYNLNRHSQESMKESVRAFNRVILLDPTFASAYVGLAQSYQFMVRYSWLPREEGQKYAKEAIKKAIELDESLGEAHAILGLIMIVFDFDIYGPEKEFQKAIRLSPNNAEVYSSYAQYLRWIGRYDEGLKVALRAAELDPLTPLTTIWPLWFYSLSGRYDSGIEYSKKLLAIDSNFAYINAFLAMNYAYKGSFSKAIYYANETITRMGKDLSFLSFLGYIYAIAGDTTKARGILKQMGELNVHNTFDPVYFASLYNVLGEKDKAFECLNKAVEIRSGQVIYLRAYADSYFKDIKTDPRFIELLEKIGFRVDYARIVADP
jgi:TolB-like protein/Tfp pilus assembly protein PilF